MFTPIKNLITYIQKNASGGSSIFGSSNTNASEESTKMESQDLKLQNNTNDIETKSKECLDSVVDEKILKEELKTPTKTTTRSVTSSPASKLSFSPVTRTSPRKAIASAMTSTTTTTIAGTASPVPIAIDEDDIEAQLDTSIMLKKPVKQTATNGTEILEVKKSPNSSGRSIYISHDVNRNHAISPITEDELEDFRHDPTTVHTSSPVNNSDDKKANEEEMEEADAEEVCLPIGGDSKATDNINEKTMDGAENETEFVQIQDEFVECEGDDDDDNGIKTAEEDNDVPATGDKETVMPEKVIRLDSEDEGTVGEAMEDDVMEDAEIEDDDVDDDNDSDETFLDLEQFPDSEVIVLHDSETDPNTTFPLESANTSDDPLAIACEEQEAFAADRTAALEELNLLNTSTNSQDEDTRTTAAEDDLQWLSVDASASERNDDLPTCSKSLNKTTSVSNGATPEKEERNGEGSDSGLGSETSALHITNSSIGDTSQLNMTTASAITSPIRTSHSAENDSTDKLVSQSTNRLASKSPLKESPKPLRSNLKRRLEVDDDEVVDSLGNITTSTSGNSSSLATSSSSSLSGSLHKKPKRSINFDNVQVFYFPRQQGFSCVPSAGGCTLGMGARHVGFKTLSLAEHAAELRRAHRMQLQEINPRGSSSDDSEESEEDYLSEGSGSDLDGESNGFLQPVSPKQRRAILKAAGVRKIDTSEKAECRDIRNSREVCGCTCRDFCDPETCSCSQSGIKCQVDRDMFPCGCSRDACGNTIGRVEFNPARVRTHFIHTLMRLEMENRQQQNPYSPAVVPSAASATAASYYQSAAHMQPQSNYSSGYASPAYNTSAAAELHQQTAANTYYHQPTTAGANVLYGAGQPSSSLDKLLAVGGSASTSQSIVAPTTTPYGMDNLDSGLFGNVGVGATPSYGELMPVQSSYHHHNINYGSVQTQVSPYNSYHNGVPYLNTNTATTTPLNTPATYSSCAVPSIPPYGTATTTEATGDYHSVNSLATTLETTIAPSCSNVSTAVAANTLDAAEASSSFISLSTPLASSSRLSQINDLLQHNRNATTALVAVSQSIGASSEPNVAAATALSATHMNVAATGGGVVVVDNYHTTSINTPPIEDAHKSCMAYVELTAPPPLKPAPIVLDVVEAAAEKQPAPTTLQQQATIELNAKETKTSSPTPSNSIVTTTPTSIVDITPSQEPTPKLDTAFESETTSMTATAIGCNQVMDKEAGSSVSLAITPADVPATIEVAAGN